MEHNVRTKRHEGFTLIELMIAVAVIAVLASIAYPSYTRYIYRTRRADGQDLLMRIAAAQERYYTNKNQYAPDLSTLGLNATSVSGYYTAVVTKPAGGDFTTGFVVTATPQAPQDGDTACGSLSVDSALNKTPSGQTSNGLCW